MLFGPVQFVPVSSDREAMTDLRPELLHENPAGSPDRVPTAQKLLSSGHNSLLPRFNQSFGDLLLKSRDHPIILELRNFGTSHGQHFKPSK